MLGVAWLSFSRCSKYCRMCSGPNCSGDLPKYFANRFAAPRYARAVTGEKLRNCNSSIIRFRNGVMPTNSFRPLVYLAILPNATGMPCRFSGFVHHQITPLYVDSPRSPSYLDHHSVQARYVVLILCADSQYGQCRTRRQRCCEAGRRPPGAACSRHCPCLVCARPTPPRGSRV